MPILDKPALPACPAPTTCPGPPACPGPPLDLLELRWPCRGVSTREPLLCQTSRWQESDPACPQLDPRRQTLWQDRWVTLPPCTNKRQSHCCIVSCVLSNCETSISLYNSSLESTDLPLRASPGPTRCPALVTAATRWAGGLSSSAPTAAASWRTLTSCSVPAISLTSSASPAAGTQL